MPSLQIYFTLVTSFFFIISIFPSHTLAAPLPTWLEPLFPKKRDGFHGEIICYTLPYGGLGFASHILTYYTVGILAAGRQPLMPWRKLKHAFWDHIVSWGGLVIGTAFAVFTIVRCRQRWQFMLIAIWKTTMAMTLGFIRYVLFFIYLY